MSRRQMYQTRLQLGLFSLRSLYKEVDNRSSPRGWRRTSSPPKLFSDALKRIVAPVSLLLQWTCDRVTPMKALKFSTIPLPVAILTRLSASVDGIGELVRKVKELSVPLRDNFRWTKRVPSGYSFYKAYSFAQDVAPLSLMSCRKDGPPF